MRAAVLVSLLVLALSSCASLDPSLGGEVRRKNRFQLIEDDGRNAVWSARTLTREEAREWLNLLVTERKRVEDFFATAEPGKINLWLVEDLPKRFSGDGFAQGRDIFVRLGARGSPGSSEMSLVTHEMTHVILLEAFGMSRPFWFEEGLATYLEGQRLGFGAGGRDMLSGASDLESLAVDSLTLENVEGVERPLAYRLSASAIELILEKHGGGAIRRLQRESSSRAFADGYFRVTGESLSALEKRWRDEIRAILRLRAMPR
jgi:hypothetical protein